MADFKQAFPNENAFLPVVNVQGGSQVIRNAEIAYDNGADGIMLIDHNGDSELLRICYEAVRCRFPKMWIGVNWIGLSFVRALANMEACMQALWIDDAHIYDDEVRTAGRAGQLAIERQAWEEEKKNHFLLFGGVAFKYQRHIENVELAARLAAPYMDVITTSGDRTGEPPTLGKIEAMRRGAGNHPMAIASGITKDNVQQFLPFIDCFLVRTSITDKDEILIPAEVEKLAWAIGR